MVIQSKAGDGYALLSISGRLDAVTSAEAESAIGNTIESGAVNLLLDLSELEYISSAGLRVLLATAKKLSRQDGRIAICGIRDNVREVFSVSGFLSIFPIAADESEAAKSFQKA